MGLYAQATSVSVEKSRAEIESLLRRYGAEQFASGWDTTGRVAMIGFRAKNRFVKFLLPMPSQADCTKTPNGRYRSTNSVKTAFEQECRRRWRALALLIKAKLESVETGITVFDDEFLAHIVLPGDRTVGQMVRAQIEEVYKTGRVGNLLPGIGESSASKTGGA